MRKEDKRANDKLTKRQFVPRNSVVLSMIANPKRNAGKHSTKYKSRKDKYASETE